MIGVCVHCDETVKVEESNGAVYIYCKCTSINTGAMGYMAEYVADKVKTWDSFVEFLAKQEDRK